MSGVVGVVGALGALLSWHGSIPHQDGRSTMHQPAVRPVLRVQPAAGPIAIDGVLDDAGWRNATPVTSFTEFEPRQMVPAAVPITAWVSYDEARLYVAFRVTDDPAKVRATLRGRDQIFGDDLAGIILDTFGDNGWAYVVAANPLGIQFDMRIAEGAGDDPTFDVIFESAGRITDSGYTIELAVPFGSLRFPTRHEQRWKLNLVVIHPRETNRQYAWAAIRDEACILCQSGALVGLEGVTAGRRIELLPALVGSHAARLEDADDPESWTGGDPGAAVALGLRYPVHSGWTAEATVNPDFSQVESDAAQIDVNTTFALFSPERRPFFQEGSDLFDTWVDQVYTRSINAPVAATKIVGRPGRLNLGYIGAIDGHSPVILPFEERSAIFQAGRSVSNILRAKYALRGGSFVGGLITDRRLAGGGAGSTVGADALVRLSRRWSLELQLVGSRTEEPSDAGASADLAGVTFDNGRRTAVFDGERYWGHAAYVNLGREARLWNFEVLYREASPTFRADNGFETRNNLRDLRIFNAWNVYPRAGLADQLGARIAVGQQWNFQGATKRRYVSPGVSLLLKGQTRVSGGYTVEDERFRDVEFTRLGTWNVSASTAFAGAITGGASVRWGDMIARTRRPPVAGRGVEAMLSASLKPVRRLVLQPSIAYAALSDPEGQAVFAGYVLRTRMNLQFTREFSARVIVQYNDFAGRLEVDPLLMYQLNPWSILYVGSTHDFARFDEGFGMEPTERQLFLKLQYLWRP